MIYHGFKVVAAAGTAVPLSSTPLKASFITIFPRIVSGTGNTGQVRVGGKPSLAENVAFNTSTTAIPSGSGMPLNPGDAGVVWPMPAPCPVDLSTVYVDADTSNDGVQFIYGRP